MSWTSTGLNLSEQWFISQGGVDSWWALKSRVKIAVSFYWTCMSLWKVSVGFMNKIERLGSVWFPASCWMKVLGFSYSSMWIFKFVLPLLQVQDSLMGDVPVTWGKHVGIFKFYLNIILECQRDLIIWYGNKPLIFDNWSCQPSVRTLVCSSQQTHPKAASTKSLKTFPWNCSITWQGDGTRQWGWAWRSGQQSLCLWRMGCCSPRQGQFIERRQFWTVELPLQSF